MRVDVLWGGCMVFREAPLASSASMGAPSTLAHMQKAKPRTQACPGRGGPPAPTRTPSSPAFSMALAMTMVWASAFVILGVEKSFR